MNNDDKSINGNKGKEGAAGIIKCLPLLIVPLLIPSFLQYAFQIERERIVFDEVIVIVQVLKMIRNRINHSCCKIIDVE